MQQGSVEMMNKQQEHINFNGGTITAISGASIGWSGAGIGGGNAGAGGTITISGGTVRATGGSQGQESVEEMVEQVE
jgi:hypothetical protein